MSSNLFSILRFFLKQPVEHMFSTWYKEDDDEVGMVGKPDDPKHSNNDEIHLDNFPLLLHSPGDGWLPRRVLLHPEDLISSPQLPSHHRITISCNILKISELVVIHVLLTHHQEGDHVGDDREGQTVPENNSNLYLSIRFSFLEKSPRRTKFGRRH